MERQIALLIIKLLLHIIVLLIILSSKTMSESQDSCPGSGIAALFKRLIAFMIKDLIEKDRTDQKPLSKSQKKEAKQEISATLRI